MFHCVICAILWTLCSDLHRERGQADPGAVAGAEQDRVFPQPGARHLQEPVLLQLYQGIPLIALIISIKRIFYDF